MMAVFMATPMCQFARNAPSMVAKKIPFVQSITACRLRCAKSRIYSWSQH